MNPSDTASSHLDSWWFAGGILAMQIFGMAISKTILFLLSSSPLCKKKIIPWCFKNDFGGVFKESAAVLSEEVQKKSTLWQWSMLQHTKLATICIKATDDG